MTTALRAEGTLELVWVSVVTHNKEFTYVLLVRTYETPFRPLNAVEGNPPSREFHKVDWNKPDYPTEAQQRDTSVPLYPLSVEGNRLYWLGSRHVLVLLRQVRGTRYQRSTTRLHESSNSAVVPRLLIDTLCHIFRHRRINQAYVRITSIRTYRPIRMGREL